ncbi:hypothetical protein AAHA92_31711 [Salvia divinorum]|uniref:Uncharacterized protein n=1 Tax=Salvia divinorum TaxID=28513 RepID=A0ABD1FIW0_SALDI
MVRSKYYRYLARLVVQKRFTNCAATRKECDRWRALLPSPTNQQSHTIQAKSNWAAPIQRIVTKLPYLLSLQNSAAAAFTPSLHLVFSAICEELLFGLLLTFVAIRSC